MRTNGNYRRGLFILVFTFIVCTSSFADEAGWIKANNNKKCKIWNPNPVPNEYVTWDGACEDGYAHGKGVATWYKNGKINEIYEGEMFKGMYRGQGKCTYLSGNSYTGEWLNSEKHGHGEYRWANGTIYVGNFLDSHSAGNGVYFYKDGSITIGGWYKGKLDGICIAYDKEGKVIRSGKWEKGTFREKFDIDPFDVRLGPPEVLKEVNVKVLQLNEKAAQEEQERQQKEEESHWITDPNTGCRAWNPYPAPDKSIIWSGDCVNGLMEGEGTLVWYNKLGLPTDKYIGSMKTGRYEGKGSYHYESGIVYEGEFLNGKYHGKGIHHFPNGHRYEGEFQKGKRHGKGTYYYEEGRYHKGQYVDGDLNGYGVYVKFGTIVKSGRWKNDELVESFPLDLHDPRITSEEEYQAYRKQQEREHQAYLKQQEEAEKARAANIKKVKATNNANQLYILGYRFEETDLESAKLAYNKILDNYPSSDLIAKVIDRLEALTDSPSTSTAASSAKFRAGDTVCMDAETLLSSQTIKGFVENVSGDRIQIRIGSISGGLWSTLNYKGVVIEEGTVIWDEDVNWYSCN
ncbi:MAG TPA: hypothetical protein PK014_10285 [Thermoanaerobaculia bacterium]|nr:hypothetical protein [Thermoanaerobaculia bacterium]HUM30507.1 hypothetical protein [Thermoanaerobaculia bacterium]HXK68626.1 hypothetical protein [Thermoanaerobaculia bacterium]